MANDPDVGLGALAKLIHGDAVMSAQVLRAVNSSLYYIPTKVSSVQRATILMGSHAVRYLVLSLGLRDLLPTTEVGGFPLDQFWLSSVRRGAAARSLGKHLRHDRPDELFTLGLCQDFGVLANLQLNPTLASRYAAVLSQPANARLELERSQGEGHDETGFALFDEWEFPEDLCLPIRYHHRPEEAPESVRTRARIAHAAEAIADLLEVDDKAEGMAAVRERTQTLGVEDSLASIFEEIAESVSEYADLFGLSLGQQPTFEEVIEAASEGMVLLDTDPTDLSNRLEAAFAREMNVAQRVEQLTDQLKAGGSTDALIHRLGAAIAEQQELSTQLRRLNAELAAQALADPLTGLPNRRAFDQSLSREVSQAIRQQTPISLLVVDIDHFKQLNDSYGHQAGDAVLSEVGRQLKHSVRACDLPARYGGEEFTLILPFTDRAGGAVVAERIRRIIEQLSVPWRGEALRVTVSVGGATLDEARADRRGAFLFRRADDALYRAKQTGRNQVCWSRSEPTGAIDRITKSLPVTA